MFGFNKFKKIIDNNALTKNFDEFITSHINSKKQIHHNFYSSRLQNLDAFLDKKLNDLPMELDKILFNEEAKNQKDKDDKNDNDGDDDDHDFGDGMKIPIPNIFLPRVPTKKINEF